MLVNKELEKYFNSFSELISYIKGDCAKNRKLKKLYEPFCTIEEGTFEATCYEKLLEKIMVSEKVKNTCNLMFDDLIKLLDEKEKDNLIEKFALEFGDGYTLKGKDLTNIVIEAFNSLKSPLLTAKTRDDIRGVIKYFATMIAQRYSTLCCLVFNEEVAINQSLPIINNYDVKRKKVIKIKNDKAFEIAINTVISCINVLDGKNYNTNEGTIALSYVQKYNKEVELNKKVQGYFNKLTKTKLDKLSYDVFPNEEEDFSLIYTLLREEINDYVCRKGKSEELIPILDLWYYSDANREKRTKHS